MNTNDKPSIVNVSRLTEGEINTAASMAAVVHVLIESGVTTAGRIELLQARYKTALLNKMSSVPTDFMPDG